MGPVIYAVIVREGPGEGGEGDKSMSRPLFAHAPLPPLGHSL